MNVSLCEEAVRRLDRMAPGGDRSRFFDALVNEALAVSAALAEF